MTTTKGGVLHGPPKLLKTGCLEPHLATHLSGGEDSCLSEFRASGSDLLVSTWDIENRREKTTALKKNCRPLAE